MCLNTARDKSLHQALSEKDFVSKWFFNLSLICISEKSSEKSRAGILHSFRYLKKIRCMEIQ